MKKETIITGVTAVVFFGIGFLAGYIYDAQKKAGQQDLASAGESHAQEETSTGDATAEAPRRGTALPQGHPPIETPALVKTLEDEAAQNPKSAEPRLRLANFFYDQKEYDKAIEWYRLGLDLDSGNVNARTDLGTAYFYVGRPQDAIKEYRKSLQVDPRHEPTLYNLIVVNLDGTRDLAAAQEAWDRLHKMNPNYPGLENLKQRLEATLSSTPPARAVR